MSQISRITVSKHFYDMCLEQVPALQTNRAYRRMFAYLCFGSFRDKETDRLIISRDIIAQIEEKEDKAQQRNYSAVNFLKSFQRDVLPDFQYSQFNQKERKARVVISSGLPHSIKLELLDELCKVHHADGRIYFDTGKRYSRAKEQSERDYIKAMATILKAHTDASQQVLDYMNSLNSNIFTSIVERNYSTALEKAQELFLYDDDEKFLHNARVLRHVRTQVQPFYQPVDNSDRIFPLNESMLLLSKEVRRALTRGWIEFDLRSAHLAINAYLWNAPVVNEFLRSGQSIWNALVTDTYNLVMTDGIKKFFKEALYSICYGKEIRYIKADFTKFGLEYDLFLDHPVIKDLIAARDTFIAHVKSTGGYHSVFGVWLSLDTYGIKTILSILAQAVELALLLPVIDLAKRYDKVTITLWQHDGFTATIKSDEIEYWSNRLCNVVEKKALDLGIITSLEVKRL